MAIAYVILSCVLCSVVVTVDGVTVLCDDDKSCPGQQVCCDKICGDDCIGLICKADSDCGGGEYCCDYECASSSCDGLPGWVVVLIVFVCILVICLIVACVKLYICQHRYFTASTLLVTDVTPLIRYPTTSKHTSSNTVPKCDQDDKYYTFRPLVHEANSKNLIPEEKSGHYHS